MSQDLIPTQANEHALVSHEDAATQGLATREQAAVQAAIIQAKRFPRNEEKAFAACMSLAKRPTFAESAIYSKPQGGQNIEGPSVQLARALAQKWGNIRVSCCVLPSEDGWCHIEVTAIDLETNTQTQAQDRFPLRVFRKKGGWIDLSKSTAGFVEQEKRNLLNRMTAFCERSAILKLLPPDVIEDVMVACRQTSRAVASGELKASPQQVARNIIQAFGSLNVSVDMLERKLGHSLSEMSAEEVADLRTIFKSIHEGAATRDDHFETGEAASKATEEFNAKIAKAAQEAEKAKSKPAAKKAKDAPPLDPADYPRFETDEDGTVWEIGLDEGVEIRMEVPQGDE